MSDVTASTATDDQARTADSQRIDPTDAKPGMTVQVTANDGTWGVWGVVLQVDTNDDDLPLLLKLWGGHGGKWVGARNTTVRMLRPNPAEQEIEALRNTMRAAVAAVRGYVLEDVPSRELVAELHARNVRVVDDGGDQ